MNSFISTVAEFQGLDGPFSFPEKLLQKVWARGDFDFARAATADGRVVRVLHPGKWNLLGGPDFKSARLEIGGAPVTGDVEVHLHASDWAAHAHAADAAYAGVVLHVVLFQPPKSFSEGRAGRRIPILALLPLLHRDLEEYAADDAAEVLANRPEAFEELHALTPAALEALLRRHAEARWKQKVRFARLRIERLGWEVACHHAALEILGYRFNRAPMLRVAAAFPLAAWADGGNSEAALASENGRWSTQGVRPANHPGVRLRQYAAWVRARSDWPARLEAMLRALPSPESAAAGASTAEFRHANGLAGLRAQLTAEICGEAVSGSRLDNLICDGFWPLAAARGGGDFFGWWFHWPAGDQSTQILQALRRLDIVSGRVRPANHGFAQGMLGWLLAQENHLGELGWRT